MYLFVRNELYINLKKKIILNRKNGWDIKLQIEWNKKYCPLWYLVEKDIDKYLLLM
jgi:uncharacterized protein (UPF0371 family)